MVTGTGGSFNQKAIEDYSHEVENLAMCIGNQATAATATATTDAADTSQSENEENEAAPKTAKRVNCCHSGRFTLNFNMCCDLAESVGSREHLL